MLNPDLKNEMQDDIRICEECLKNKSNDSGKLYHILVAKYLMIDKSFCDGIPNYAKTFSSTYFSEIEIILEKLKMYLLLDEIPVQQNNITASIETEKKGFSSFIKKLFGR